MNSRTFEILNILLYQDCPITINQLAGKLGVSNKTIRNDLDKLEDYLKKANIRLVRKPGVGVSVEGSERNIRLAREMCQNKKKVYIVPYSPEMRRRYILKCLLFNTKRYRTKDFARNLFVSTKTIYKDLIEVEKWLEKHNLRLERQQTYLTIDGDEGEFRKTITHFIKESMNGENSSKDMTTRYSGRMNRSTYVFLKSLVNLDYRKIERLLEQLEDDLDIQFSQESFDSLIVHIAITIKRIYLKKEIVLPEETLHRVQNTKEYRYVKKMVGQLEDTFHVKFSIHEICYLTLHILGGKLDVNKIEGKNLPFKETKEFDLAKRIAEKIISIASDVLGIDLNHDEELYNGLVLHLRPTINRLKYGLSLDNPLLEEIKANFPQIYGVGWICSTVFQKVLGVKIPESEIGYIVTHLAAAVERKKIRIKTLVVCHTGIGTTKLLVAKLESYFPELEIVNIVPTNNLKEYDFTNIDVVISTVPIKMNIPYIVVSPVLSDYDIEKLEQFVRGRTSFNSEEQILFEKELFFHSIEAKNKEDIIGQMCDLLTQKGYIQNDFKRTVLEREEIVPTEVGKLFAIPHGEPQKVRKSCLALAVLKQPILWAFEEVQFVLMICITEEDRRKRVNIYRRLIELMDDELLLEKCKHHQSVARKTLAQLDCTT